jgi:hypothetical protein
LEREFVRETEVFKENLPQCQTLAAAVGNRWLPELWHRLLWASFLSFVSISCIFFWRQKTHASVVVSEVTLPAKHFSKTSRKHYHLSFFFLYSPPRWVYCTEIGIQIIYHSTLLACFPYFEKIKVGLWDHIAVCMCVYSPYHC